MLKILAVAAVLLLVAGPAQAHKVIASVWADGADIEGEVGFSNGDMAVSGTVVEIFDPNGKKLGETQVGEEGLFRFTPTAAVAHTFKANLGAGHVAQTVLAVEDLPPGLGGSTVAAVEVAAAAPKAVEAGNDLRAMIAEAVRREVKPLRKEIAAYREKNDLQSIIGGLGYICGIFGLWFFFAGRRKRD